MHSVGSGVDVRIFWVFAMAWSRRERFSDGWVSCGDVDSVSCANTVRRHESTTSTTILARFGLICTCYSDTQAPLSDPNRRRCT